jgi:hypothetical protein
MDNCEALLSKYTEKRRGAREPCHYAGGVHVGMIDPMEGRVSDYL